MGIRAFTAARNFPRSAPTIPAALRVQAGQIRRGLDGFGYAFAGHRQTLARDILADLLDASRSSPVTRARSAVGS